MKRLILIIGMFCSLIVSVAASASSITSSHDSGTTIEDEKCDKHTNICVRVGYFGHNTTAAVIETSQDKGSTWTETAWHNCASCGPLEIARLESITVDDASNWHAKGVCAEGCPQHGVTLIADSKDGANWTFTTA